jgi:hypothetical protein
LAAGLAGPVAAGPTHPRDGLVTPAQAVADPPVPGFPVGWWIRARSDVFADAKRAGFEYVELALQDVLGLPDREFEQLRSSRG